MRQTRDKTLRYARRDYIIPSSVLMLFKHIGRRDNTSHIIGANSYSVHKDISFPLKSREEESIFFEKYQNIFTFNAFSGVNLVFYGK